ncbi:hypothetical protein BpHYR1_052386 [Brachionus plicatilis]|uniref:Uncharacterized protein n=1 Tax=Brachionus plicatilis TaxID=10195 RepID=A0A3M7SX49_BRAPC|nr:hypothetical protein BpHYR1_052386 [Brachionus plicatilis]
MCDYYKINAFLILKFGIEEILKNTYFYQKISNLKLILTNILDDSINDAYLLKMLGNCNLKKVANLAHNVCISIPSI